MNHLHRELAPIGERAWDEITEEAGRSLRHFLTARKLVEFDGPHGWDRDALGLGRVTHEPLESDVEGVEPRVRLVQPLTELRTPFTLSRDEIDAAERGAPDADWDPVIDAARRAALAEDHLVFRGSAAAGVRGIVQTSPHEPIIIGHDYDDYPKHVALAIERLKRAGVSGPYAIALGPRCYTGVIESTQHGGYPVLSHLRLIAEGPVLWAPAVEGAIVMSQRGGDFELVVGQDLSIGYLDHDATSVRLYLEESLTFRAAGPEAAIALRYED
ncbi:family 1 encapsulin nanocompartment shell protein [Miltoncostaea marina]|uniref:family 1 encapsulin nanocompartment shell protein n=1 Tax=Miltoncostaea marina TaxID=2843215 RepID=UPI001C3E8137|nr:family 1 encapsulin nanocompartment shell protein [Miltoncostaea marina]